MIFNLLASTTFLEWFIYFIHPRSTPLETSIYTQIVHIMAARIFVKYSFIRHFVHFVLFRAIVGSPLFVCCSKKRYNKNKKNICFLTEYLCFYLERKCKLYHINENIILLVLRLCLVITLSFKINIKLIWSP